MGVPKFYRWISERYPCLSDVIQEHKIPEFDNLYLDLNGVIHTNSHPDDDNVHFRISETQIFKNIFDYIDFLFRMIKPQKLFFMAVDGVAPRAKMNQQRSRRFRTAREAKDKENKASAAGEVLPSEARFDSNCITPGTEFMMRLHEGLQHFVALKISTDPLWRHVRVILSGHETPGEGEHKIMDFLRWQRLQSDYSPDTRHCLYGLDADLMMLGLASHELHFSLLREEIVFGKNVKRSNSPEHTTFHLLYLSLMRDYIAHEFEVLSHPGMLNFPFDIKRIIDDWVLMGFLVGNDFVPHLPNMHIHREVLPYLWENYKKVLPQLDGYLHENGELNLKRLECYLVQLGKFDKEQFDEEFQDMKWLHSKTSARTNLAKQIETLGQETAAVVADNKEDKSTSLRTTSQRLSEMEPGLFHLKEFEMTDSEDDDSDDISNAELVCHKRDYYENKLEVSFNDESLLAQAQEYVRALQWILFYYYRGVPDWGWFYPFHYAPYISDVRGFQNMEMGFQLGEPFLPFEQLLAVLPPLSKSLLPTPYQKLMEENSAVFDFYPDNFVTDLNGKRQEWEAVVKIPFIHERRLLDAMRPLLNRLTEEEKRRNQHGPHLLYEYALHPSETELSSSLPGVWPEKLAPNHAQRTPLDKFYFNIDTTATEPQLQSSSGLYFPGFPILGNLPHEVIIAKKGVKVFQQPSRSYNLLLNVLCEEPDDVENEAITLLGSSLLVNWPHLSEVLVVGVSAADVLYQWIEPSKGDSESFSSKTCPKYRKVTVKEQHQHVIKMLQEMAMTRRGICVPSKHRILLHCRASQGRRYSFSSNDKSVHLQKQWSNEITFHLWSLCIKSMDVQDSTLLRASTLDEIFPVGATCFSLASHSYGLAGEVVAPPLPDGRICVQLVSHQILDLTRLIQRQHDFAEQYYEADYLGKRLGINGHLVSRLTGCIFMTRGAGSTSAAIDDVAKNKKEYSRVNLALNLKFNKTNQEVIGWTKKMGNRWLYSLKICDVIDEYRQKFPYVFEYLAKNNCEEYKQSEVFSGRSDADAVLQELLNFLKQLPCSVAQRTAHGNQILTELMIKELEREVSSCQIKQRTSLHKIKAAQLFRSLTEQTNLLPDPTVEVRLCDRVVSVRVSPTGISGTVTPLGLRGTVIGLLHNQDLSASKQQNTDAAALTILEVLFDEEFPGALSIRGSGPRCARLSLFDVINLSHGERCSAAMVHTKQQLESPVTAPKNDASETKIADERYATLWRDLGGDLSLLAAAAKLPQIAVVVPSSQEKLSQHQQQQYRVGAHQSNNKTSLSSVVPHEYGHQHQVARPAKSSFRQHPPSAPPQLQQRQQPQQQFYYQQPMQSTASYRHPTASKQQQQQQQLNSEDTSTAMNFNALMKALDAEVHVLQVDDEPDIALVQLHRMCRAFSWPNPKIRVHKDCSGRFTANLSFANGFQQLSDPQCSPEQAKLDAVKQLQLYCEAFPELNIKMQQLGLSNHLAHSTMHHHSSTSSTFVPASTSQAVIAANVNVPSGAPQQHHRQLIIDDDFWGKPTTNTVHFQQQQHVDHHFVQSQSFNQSALSLNSDSQRRGVGGTGGSSSGVNSNRRGRGGRKCRLGANFGPNVPR